MKKLRLANWTNISPHRIFPGESMGDLAVRWPEFSDEANRDPMTGLPNNRAYNNAIEIAVKEANRQGAGFGLIILDIDYFKKFNDTYGHQAGDAVLKTFAGVVSGAVRDHDLVARYGGEEFVIITPALNKVFEVGERVRLAVEKTRFHLPQAGEVSVTCSFGCAVYPADARDTGELFKVADECLYQAKNNGRNRGYAKCSA